MNGLLRVFSGFLKKEAFASKLKELALPEKENITREDVEKRAAKLFGEPPVKKEQLFQLSKQYIMQIESLAIWEMEKILIRIFIIGF